MNILYNIKSVILFIKYYIIILYYKFYNEYFSLKIIIQYTSIYISHVKLTLLIIQNYNNLNKLSSVIKNNYCEIIINYIKYNYII